MHTPAHLFLDFQSLLTLPPELLSDIFYRIQEDSPLPSSPICSRLYPFQQAALYRIVTLISFKQFQLFLRTILGYSQVGGLVRHLEVPRDMEELDLPIGSVRQLLLRLSNVESLNLGTMYDGIETVISRDSGSRKILQKMKHLVIGGIPPQLTFGSDWLSNLASYPSLASLDLRMTGFVSSGISTLSTAKSLALRNLFQSDLETVRRICHRLPTVETLLFDARIDQYFDFQSILETLSSHRATPPLRSLTLLGESRVHLGLPFCDSYLLSFTNLSYLYLGLETNWFSSDTGSSLRQLLHLETIGFGYNAFLARRRAREPRHWSDSSPIAQETHRRPSERESWMASNGGRGLRKASSSTC